MKLRFLFFLLVILMGACQRGVDITNFDEKGFQQDAHGCAGTREGMKEKLFDITSQLKGLSEDQVQATLGKPDREELADRNQKYFIYFIEPSPECKNKILGKNPLTLYIRFSAVGLSSEISFKNY